MKPLVSILIPAYNAQETVVATMQSAVSQTWPRAEIVVVDDGSRDSTLSILRRFAASNVKVFSQANQGAAAARNQAFSLCSGDYVQWLDADDLLVPNKIASQMELVERAEDSRLLPTCAWGRFMYRPERAEFAPTSLWADLSPAEWLMRQMEENIYMQTATWLVSRELTEAAGPWNTQLLGDDDGEYFARILLASRGTRFVSEAKVYYRMSGPKSLSYIGHSDKKRDAQWISMKLHIEYVRSVDDSPRARAACVTYLQNWMIYFYPERMDIFERARVLAHELGGQLIPPPLSRKYAWIKKMFGWPLARRAQVLAPRVRWSLRQSWDKAMLRWEQNGFSAN